MNEYEFEQRYSSYMKKHQVKFGNYYRVMTDAIENDLQEIDFDLLVVFEKNKLFEYDMTRPSLKAIISFKKYFHKVCMSHLDKYELQEFEEAFRVISLYAMLLNKYGIKRDYYRKSDVSIYKEVEQIKAIVKKFDPHPKKWFDSLDIQAITFKPVNSRTIPINEPFLIGWIIRKLKEEFESEYWIDRDDSKPEYRVSDFNEHKRGKPESMKTKALRTMAYCICEYLDFKNKLIPDKGVRISDQRRKFIAELFEALNILPKNVVLPKDYINSLLLNYQ